MEKKSVISQTEIPYLYQVHGSKIGEVVFSTNVAGTTFVPYSAELLKTLKTSVPRDKVVLFLNREPENPYDPNAVRVDISVQGSRRSHKIGYIPKDMAPFVGYALQHSERYRLDVLNINFFGGEAGKENIGVFFEYRITDLQREIGEVDKTDMVYNLTEKELDSLFDFDELD